MPNESGRIHEHKALVSPCEKLLSVHLETRSESAHGHCLVGFVFKRATHGIRCSSAGAGDYQTASHYCDAGVPPLLDWG